MKPIIATLIMAMLTACANRQPDPNYLLTIEQYQASAIAQQEALKTAAAGCNTDLCRYMIAEKATSGTQVPEYRRAPNAWLQALDRVSSIVGTVAPIYGAKELARQHRLTVGNVADAVASVPRADNSTTTTISVGGNYGDTDQSTTYGDAATIGDANGDGPRAGGDVTIGNSNDNSGRIESPGPIDNSNDGDEGNVVNPEPPVET